MRTFTALAGTLLWTGLLHAQLTLNPNPSRAIGHDWVTPKSAAPNFVEGREFNTPQGVAIDTRANPPILYVSDLGNNRVLAWRDATKAREGAYADLVIGQRDKFSTTAWGPGTTFTSGLALPTGLAVDAQGNFYVVDTGNNRILRYPKPFEQTPGDVQIPDLVIGQTSLNSNRPNADGVSARSIAVNVSNRLYRTALAFDSEGNLYFTDAGNHRVLRYAASALGPGAPYGPAANLVLGQTDFLTNTAPPSRPDAQTLINKNLLPSPGGLAVTSTYLFVSDGYSRVLVYALPNYIGQAASRIMGLLVVPQGQPAPPLVNKTQFGSPEGIVVIGGAPAVCDAGNHRILVFDPMDKWPAETPASISPEAIAVIGQGGDFYRGKASAGASGLSGPVQAVLFNNELYVADSLNNRVIVLPQQSASPPAFSAASRVVGQLGMDFSTVNLIEGKELFLFSSTYGGRGGVAVDTKSDPPRLYIADTFNNRVLGFRDARRVKTGDKADLVIGQDSVWRSEVNYPYKDPDLRNETGLFFPTGLAVDANGDLYVADSANARVLRFAKPFNQSGIPRANLVLGQFSFVTKLRDATRSTMAEPYALALTGQGHLLVSDIVHNRVLLFQRPAGGDFTNGQPAAAKIGQPDFVSAAASSGTPVPLNRLKNPTGIALDSSDRLYICDTGNSRVLIFGNVHALKPEDDPFPVDSLTGLRSPQGIFVSQSTGEIWVANTAANQALRYPQFDLLAPRGYKAEVTISSPGPLALVLDALGNLFIADATNRVAIYYPQADALNGASFLYAAQRPLSPGVWATVKPRDVQLGSETKIAGDLPLPRVMADLQVLFNDEPAPLYYVSPGQINFLVPMKAPSSGNVELVVQRASTGQILASTLVPMGPASPALFTVGSTGSGLVAALNQDNTVNTPSTPVGRGEVIQLFATGQGPVEGAPPDGEAASGLIHTSERPRVWIEPDYVPDDHLLYSGLAPGLVGVWQINVKVPDRTAPGQRLTFVQLKSISSQAQTRIVVR